MPTILMPALSPTMEEGKLAKWLKAVGDTVKSGDILVEIETDKATMEVEAIDEGVLSAILVPEGTEGVKVNAPIAVIGEASIAAMSPPSLRDTSPSGEDKEESAPSSSPEGEVARRAGGETLSDPEIPPGTEMITMTVREALRSAMSEEMRRDKDVFLMGEEVGQYQGLSGLSIRPSLNMASLALPRVQLSPA
jgi:pyruvate dehydrogenase E1 component beta subunit